MPLHDVLEGRYPATATLQNAHADAAAGEWLRNATHLHASQQWLRAVLRAVAPYANDVVAIALDDDQGAYLDNDTWPAPHWHAYVDWLRLTVRAVTGSRVPLFINTYEMKVPAASPAWAWGDWYQSDAYRIGAHDLAELDFATGLLQTQADRPVMYAEFQAGWLQGADEARPRGRSDPANTALALARVAARRRARHRQLSRAGHGLSATAGRRRGRTGPTRGMPRLPSTCRRRRATRRPRAFGDDVRRYGALLARTHLAADAAIIWPPSLFSRPAA